MALEKQQLLRNFCGMSGWKIVSISPLTSLMFRVNDGKIAKMYPDLAPWAKDIADSLSRE